jgi:hypothetical protein
MAAVVTFDPASLRILEINSGLAINALSAKEIYSEWKDWLLADPSRLGYPAAFTPVGGDPTIGSDSLGVTLFLENGWKIRPAEYSHKLIVDGNLFSRDGSSVFAATLGAYNVHTETKVSNLVDRISIGSGLSSGESTMLLELYRIMGLDPTRPLVVTSAARGAGAEIEQSIAENPPGTVTVTRV